MHVHMYINNKKKIIINKNQKKNILKIVYKNK